MMPDRSTPPEDDRQKVLAEDKRKAADLDRKRHVKDKAINGLIASGGIFVLVAIVSIFFYLLSVSWPLFFGSEADKGSVLPIDRYGPASVLQLEEYGEIGMRLNPVIQAAEFFSVKQNKVVQTTPLLIPEGLTITAAKKGSADTYDIGLALSDGSFMVVRPQMSGQGLGDERVYSLSVEYPYGEEPLKIADVPLSSFDFIEGSQLTVAYAAGDQLAMATFSSSNGGSSILSYGDEASTEYTLEQQLPIAGNAAGIMALELSQGNRWLYAISKAGYIEVLKFEGDRFMPYQRIDATAANSITASTMLQGDVSLIIGDAAGEVSQWFIAPGQNGSDELTKIRSFNFDTQPISFLAPEPSRKGILAGSDSGRAGYLYTTSDREVYEFQFGDTPILGMSLSPEGSGLLVADQDSIGYWHIEAEHPDVSFASLWAPVWYESYPKPEFVWQSSSGSSDFEAKMSLTPLTFGTLKAAFWAMIFSAPLAIGGAIYTAIFMSPALRTKVKPALELMEALPTVILGFLAGLWLAPIVTAHLPFVFSLLLVLPLVALVTGFAWMQLPLEKRNSVPAGIAPVIVILPILIGSVIAFYATETLQAVIFAQYDGSMVNYLRNSETGLGIDYQDQNALIVGLIMGFAVIPTIFSIAEDALFAVPRHLTNGSLALGATPWQTLTRVVLLTASPGIFSALMIGLGRAVGETMIVLMATGNTPIMDLSLFNGMRTLSANVAVEMGEAEVGSTHFRVLFLSALVLFVLTFIVNTAAEVVRARLRKKYGSL